MKDMQNGKKGVIFKNQIFVGLLQQHFLASSSTASVPKPDANAPIPSQAICIRTHSSFHYFGLVVVCSNELQQ